MTGTICFGCYYGDCNEHRAQLWPQRSEFKLIETAKPKPASQVPFGTQSEKPLIPLVRPLRTESSIFTMNPLVQYFGTASDWTVHCNPCVVFRATRLFVNVDCPGLVYIRSILVANINVQIGSGEADGYTFSRGRDKDSPVFKVDCPTVGPQNMVSVSGRWTGYVPPGRPVTGAFLIALDFEGESAIIE